MVGHLCISGARVGGNTVSVELARGAPLTLRSMEGLSPLGRQQLWEALSASRSLQTPSPQVY